MKEKNYRKGWVKILVIGLFSVVCFNLNSLTFSSQSFSVWTKIVSATLASSSLPNIAVSSAKPVSPITILLTSFVKALLEVVDALRGQGAHPVHATLEESVGLVVYLRLSGGTPAQRFVTSNAEQYPR